MLKSIEASMLATLRTFVDSRIEAIASADRARIDATYFPFELARRNKWNWHDYDAYMRAIEDGFGREVQGYESFAIESMNETPLRGLVVWNNPQYGVRVWTVQERATLWLIGMRDHEPKVMLPAFDGHCFDKLVSGGLVAPRPPGSNVASLASRFLSKLVSDVRPTQANSAARVARFDQHTFSRALAERVSLELNQVKRQLRFDRVRALALHCDPAGGELILSLMTEREDPGATTSSKWDDIAAWRYFDFSSTPIQQWPAAADLCDQMTKFYGESEDEGAAERRLRSVLQACASALVSEEVSAALTKYEFSLSADFECGVFRPDDPEPVNYCR